jgi:hypothetical protein
MIRIEGIPIVAARLAADAQKAQPTKARKATHGRSEIAKSGKTQAFGPRMQTKTKAA